MTLILGLGAIAVAFSTWRIWRRLRFFAHVFQLEGYKLDEFTAWLDDRRKDLLIRRSHLLGVAALVLGVILYVLTSPFWASAGMLTVWPVVFASSRRYRNAQAKKPLVFTSRLKRLASLSALLSALPVVILVLLGSDGLAVVPHLLAGLLVADVGCPQWVMIAAKLLHPNEERIQQGFKDQARAKLNDRPDLKIIAITGSYGKTSVKSAIATILGHRYNVLATPGSYNTPMGLCKVINNLLKPEHQVLVLEMGARYVGDIQELCELATPSIGIVTNVGVAHLESMGSIDGIALEKGTLVENVDPGGSVVLNEDDPFVAQMSARNSVANMWRVGIDNTETACLVASDVSYNTEGASFVIRDEGGRTEKFHTRLLGRHNIMNILIAVAVGRIMGLRLRQMTHAVSRIEPVAHRLNMRKDGGVLVLDDAFNSNPVGARNAIEILGQFSDGRRIVVTPGMIELGELQQTENKALGWHIADNADVVLLIGRQQTEPILGGLIESGFDEDAVHVFDSLRDAQRFLKGFLRAGDVVLYENDLPDQYDEAA